MPFASETTLRASFFDFTAVAQQPDTIADQSRYLEDGVLTLRDGKVVSLESWESAQSWINPATLIDLRGQLIVPGFIDTHIH